MQVICLRVKFIWQLQKISQKEHTIKDHLVQSFKNKNTARVLLIGVQYLASKAEAGDSLLLLLPEPTWFRELCLLITKPVVNYQYIKYIFLLYKIINFPAAPNKIDMSIIMKRIRVYCSIFVGQCRDYFLYNKQNNTWMFGNLKLFLVLNRISHSFALFNTRNKFHIYIHTTSHRTDLRNYWKFTS